MICYKHNETGEVYAYEQSDIDKVNQINAGNEDGIDSVFFKIRDNLANCTKMAEAEVEEHLNPQPTPKPEPTQVTRRQAKIYLHRQGLLDAVESALDELDEPMKTEARIEWEEALTFDRDNPLIAMIASVMEWSESELDEMYIEANKI